MHASYGTNLSSLMFRQSGASTKSLASLMEKQECLRELSIRHPCKGVLTAVIAVLWRANVRRSKRWLCMAMWQEEIVTSWPQQLRWMDCLSWKYWIWVHSKMINTHWWWNQAPSIVMICQLFMVWREPFHAALSLPTLTVIHLPCAMTNVDLNAFADALETRKARGLPGLKYLRE